MEHHEVMDTLPWTFTGATRSIDGKYAIGAIVSETLGSVIVSIGHDGPDMDQNLARTNAAGVLIVGAVNALTKGRLTS